MKRIKMFEDFQKDITKEEPVITVDTSDCDSAFSEEEEENIEIIEKAQPCGACEGNGCGDCNGLGFANDGDID